MLQPLKSCCLGLGRRRRWCKQVPSHASLSSTARCHGGITTGNLNVFISGDVWMDDKVPKGCVEFEEILSTTLFSRADSHTSQDLSQTTTDHREFGKSS
jgi:hypothetical protein